MKPYFSFDASYVPPAPVLPVRLAHPDGASIGIVLPLLVDTGADCTMIPLSTSGPSSCPPRRTRG